MGKPWTIWRVVWVCVGLGLVGFGIDLLVGARGIDRGLEADRAAKLMDAPVDLSTPGEFTFPFHHAHYSHLGEVLVLRVPEAVLQGPKGTNLTEGLEAGLLVFGKSERHAVVSASEEQLVGSTFDGAVEIFQLPDFARGEYRAKITVAKGALALKGISQRLEGRYVVCGLEHMAAQFGYLFGTLSLLTGGLIAGINAGRAAGERRRLRREVQTNR